MGARIAAVLAAAFLAGCAVSTPYPNTRAKNLTVNLNMEGSLFASEEVVLGVNDIEEDCTLDYQGEVELSPGANEVGLAPGQRTYLQVSIAQDHMFLRDSVQTRGTLLTPASNRRYEMEVAYVDDMFDLRLYRLTASGREEMELTPAPACLSAG